MIFFTHEEDARRVLEVLPKRFAKYGLTLHPEKTRLTPCPEEPYALMRARTDLWEPWASNRPGPPGLRSLDAAWCDSFPEVSWHD